MFISSAPDENLRNAVWSHLMRQKIAANNDTWEKSDVLHFWYIFLDVNESINQKKLFDFFSLLKAFVYELFLKIIF